MLGQHMSMDPVLLDACGDVLAAQFAGVTKVLTGAPVQGLSVAYVVARHCEVPMIFARQGVPLTMKGQRILTAEGPSGPFNVSAEFLGPSDRVLIVDDFLASGQSARALQQICAWALSRPIFLTRSSKTCMYTSFRHATHRDTMVYLHIYTCYLGIVCMILYDTCVDVHRGAEAGVQVAGFAFLALNKTQLVGQRAAANGNGPCGRESLGSSKVVVLAEVQGGVKQGRCEVKVAEWLQRMA